ncbi:hypothetical protein VOLCADRAFT_102913 [Volvox carteri f. nagariensis]|uniref:Carboxypeptidase n=1 Tax=Volvox carteri f. nagariensis TaxID=3068 RepID=D8TGT0_VOLCA|nr:uncharacterized protein VOLCADRAFT_102913 [Volvox carteri f. nagariensis]EFJ52952.1 hypothetical protein VOLCADRAFT_102913 [Volvox carteri f. nagariensis]|eukprot:XP_002945957.1 hypothetical protein VOLCADRAFT_102913 [Volvox carteri f. nagariensis]
MGFVRSFGLALCASILFLAVSTCGQGDRLVEKEIHLPLDPRYADTPLVDPPKRIAGYFRLNRTHDARMFYFFFQSRNAPKADPLVLWMTGGPGCSSEIAIFYENGPYFINNDTRTLTETKYGWDTLHNMIFVDQPIGTGFSYSDDWRDRVYNEVVVGEDMLDFLYAFYSAHPELLENDFFVTGESYAGHYVPAVSSAIYRANELGQGPFTIPLRGLAIGNGMTAPSLQFPAYAEYALQNGIISKGLHDSIQFWMPMCRWGAEFCDSHQWRAACALALQVCQLVSFDRILAANPGINVYDITKTCDGPLCYDMSAADEFLNRADVRAELGVGERRWEECNMGVNGDFLGDWLRSYDKLLPALLDDGIRVMIYAGDLDLICNWVGNERWVNALEWEQSEGWPQVWPQEWQVAGAAAGTVRELGPLSFVRVYQARAQAALGALCQGSDDLLCVRDPGDTSGGHMVPMDQPRAALQMLTLFTRGKSLSSTLGDLDERLRARLERGGRTGTQAGSQVGPQGQQVEAEELLQQQQLQQQEAAQLEDKARHGAGAGRREETYRRDKYGEAGAGAAAGTDVDAVAVKGVLGRHGIREPLRDDEGFETS